MFSALMKGPHTATSWNEQDSKPADVAAIGHTTPKDAPPDATPTLAQLRAAKQSERVLLGRLWLDMPPLSDRGMEKTAAVEQGLKQNAYDIRRKHDPKTTRARSGSHSVGCYTSEERAAAQLVTANFNRRYGAQNYEGHLAQRIAKESSHEGLTDEELLRVAIERFEILSSLNSAERNELLAARMAIKEDIRREKRGLSLPEFEAEISKRMGPIEIRLADEIRARRKCGNDGGIAKRDASRS